MCAAAIDGLRYRVVRDGVSTDQVRDVRISRHGERLLVTLRDVTEREHSEQDVRSSEMSLRALVDGVFDEALMTVDPAGNVVSWNTGAERIFGYTAAADGRAALLVALSSRMAGDRCGRDC